MTTDQKIGMSILDVGIGVGGVVLAFAIANFWNPVGWAAAIAGLTYTGLTALGSWALESYFVEDNKKKYGW